MPLADPLAPEIASLDRSWAMACHLAPLLGYVIAIPGAGILFPLLVWLCRRDESDFVNEQGLRAVNFQAMMGLLALGSWMLVPLLVGVPLLLAVRVIGAVFAVSAALRSASGRSYRYPVGVGLVRSGSFRG